MQSFLRMRQDNVYCPMSRICCLHAFAGPEGVGMGGWTAVRHAARCRGSATTKSHQHHTFLFEPTPYEAHKCFRILFGPNRLLRIGKHQMPPSSSRHDHLRRWTLYLHGCVSSPLKRVPAVRFDMVCGDENEKGQDLYRMSATLSK